MRGNCLDRNQFLRRRKRSPLPFQNKLVQSPQESSGRLLRNTSEGQHFAKNTDNFVLSHVVTCHTSSQRYLRVEQ
jgi:hypothetical protein